MEEEKEVLECDYSCDSCPGCSQDLNEDDTLYDGTITFTDEQGKNYEFTVLDVISMDEKEYLVVLPVVEDKEDEGVLILEIKTENGEEFYDTVIDDNIAEKVFAIFQENNESMDLDEEDDDYLEDNE